jgi:hypothetical protein
MTRRPISAGLGIAIGVGIGTAIGVALGHVGPWLAIGAGVGLLIPSHFGRDSAGYTRSDQAQK